MKTLQNHLPRLLLLVGLFVAGQALLAATTHTRARAIVAPPGYDGALMQQFTLDDEARQSGLIVYGVIDSGESRDEGDTIVTNITMEVLGTLRGKADETLTFTLPGGVIDGTGLAVGGVPNFVSGEKVLLFFDNPHSKQLVGWWQGKYTLAGSEAIQVDGHKRVPVTSIESQLERSLGHKVELPKDGPNVSSDPFVAQGHNDTLPPYSTSSPYSCPGWADSALPVEFEVNTANPGSGGPGGSDFARFVYNSWHAWQALTDSHVAFSYTGTSSLGQDYSDGHNVIMWGNIPTSGVLGVNYCSWSGSGRFDSDTMIDNADYSWDADDSNGINSSSYSLQAVLEHELGHGLSLGHSDLSCNGSASTPLMCPAVSNGVRKTILADDKAGAAYLYSLSGSVPTAPMGLSAIIDGVANDLTWTASSSGSPFAYEIERSSTGCSGAFKSINTVPASATSYTDDDYGDGLGSGTWCYRVKALNSGGDSPYSSKVAPVGQSGDPLTVGVSPASGVVNSGTAMTFTATFQHTTSYTQLKRNDLIFASSPAAVLQGCWVTYRSDINGLYMVADDGSWLYAGQPGVAGSAENSRCKLDAAASSKSASGTNMVVSFRVTFKPEFSGGYNLYMQNQDLNTGEWSAFTDRGDVTIQTSGSPQTVSVSPSSGTVDADIATTVSGTFRHTGSYSQLKRNDVIVAPNLGSLSQSCWLIYRQDLNRLYLRDGGSYLDAGNPGSGTTVESAACSLDAAASSVDASGTDMTVNFRVTFNPAFSGWNNLYMQNEDKLTGEWSAFTDRGDLGIVADGAPLTVSVSPSNLVVNTDTSTTLTATFRHEGAWQQLKRSDLIIATDPASSLQGCWLIYRADLGRLYLKSDNGAYLDAGRPGSGQTVANSQCTLDAAASSATASGTDVVVNFRVSFKSGFEGSYNSYMQDEDKMTGAWSSLGDRGNVTVQ